MLDVSKLPKISPAIANAMNNIAVMGWSFPLSSGEEEAEREALDISFGYSSSEVREIFNVRIEVSGVFGAGILSFNISLLDMLSDLFFPDWREEEPAKFPIEWRATITFSSLAGYMGFEPQIGKISVNINKEQTIFKANVESLIGVVSLRGESRFFSINFLSVEAMEGFKIAHERQLNSIDPGFLCKLALPSRKVLSKEYKDITTGDVILVTKTENNNVPIIGELANILQFYALLSENGAVVISKVEKHTKRVLPMTGKEDEDFEDEDFEDMDFDDMDFDDMDFDNFENMESEVSDLEEPNNAAAPGHHKEADIEDLANAAQNTSPIAQSSNSSVVANQPDIGASIINNTDNLPITLDFLFKKRKITMAELQSLKPGVNIDLQIDLNAPVLITANGTSMGFGHLVRIGDNIGIQIAQWPNSRENQDA